MTNRRTLALALVSSSLLSALAGPALLTVPAFAGGKAAPKPTTSPTPTTSTAPTTPTVNTGTLPVIADLISADESWKAGYTGKGIDIALIDSGVAPVAGLTSGNVINGPDLSFESQDPATTNLDTFGHGTHMAGLIVGRDKELPADQYAADPGFEGIAPDARLISLKMATSDGAVDVSQMIAGINWVTQHATSPGFNIRVINLSFGTDGIQSYQLDPLSYAIEQAWRKGIVVVVAAGNDGTTKTELANPAANPNVIAVGAMDHKNTLDILDDRVADFANRGTAKRKPDFAAPGVSVQGLRVPGSFLDETYPTARVGDRFFRGSGTSQAAAIASGSVALLLQRYPQLTPRQVKDHLTRTAVKNDMSGSFGLGNGVLNVRAAQLLAPSTVTTVQAPYGSGIGTLEGARGSAHVTDCDDAGVCVDLVGEQDIMGRAWNAKVWAAKVSNNTSWDGGTWNGVEWTGNDWTGASWTGDSFSGRTWSGRTWSGRTWSGRTWSGRTWSGRTWSGDAWSAGTWSGRTWSGRTWSGRTWSTGSWAGGSWS